MLRKLVLAGLAAAALAAAALSPTTASAHGWRGGWHGGWHGGGFHRGWGGPRYFARPVYFGGGYGGCYVRRLVPTPWGYRTRLINRCY